MPWVGEGSHILQYLKFGLDSSRVQAAAVGAQGGKSKPAVQNCRVMCSILFDAEDSPVRALPPPRAPRFFKARAVRRRLCSMLDLCVSLQKGIRRCGGRSTGHTCGALKKRLRGDAAMLRCRHDSSSSLSPCQVSGEYAVAWADTLLSTLTGRPQAAERPHCI